MNQPIFLWSWRNEEHIGLHNVEPDEAAHVVKTSQPPYPRASGDEKWMVWGRTRRGRYLQAVLVRVLIEDVHAEEFQSLARHEQIALEAGEKALRIIHARDLTEAEQRRFRRRKRGS